MALTCALISSNPQHPTAKTSGGQMLFCGQVELHFIYKRTSYLGGGVCRDTRHGGGFVVEVFLSCFGCRAPKKTPHDFPFRFRGKFWRRLRRFLAFHSAFHQSAILPKFHKNSSFLLSFGASSVLIMPRFILASETYLCTASAYTRN